MFTKSQNFTPSEYDVFLFNVIQDLDKYPCRRGTEGAAYFIDDKFVVKEYVKKNSCIEEVLFDEIFQHYFEEMKSFSKKGYSVPNFYSWLKIPNPNRLMIRNSQNEMSNKYYVLQEKMQGRNLYYDIDSVNEVYDLIKHLCSFNEFFAMNEDLNYGNEALRVEILKTYISDYIMVNQMLESMPENEMEKFIVSGHQMMLDGKYSHPDIYRNNIIVDSSKISIIDNRVNDPDSGTPYWDKCTQSLFGDILQVLELNNSARDSFLMCSADFDKNKELVDLSKQNKRICMEVLKKMIKIFMNRLNMKSIRKYSFNRMHLNRILGEDAVEVLQMLEA